MRVLGNFLSFRMFNVACTIINAANHAWATLDIYINTKLHTDILYGMHFATCAIL